MSDEDDALFRQVFADHFPGARVEGSEVDVAFGNLRIACSVADVHDGGKFVAASLYFSLASSKLGDEPVFASMSGYGQTAKEAIVTGACNWAHTFGPVLRAGLAGDEQPKVERFECTIDGRPFRVFVDVLGRVLGKDSSDDGAQRLQGMRARWGAAPWLTRRIVESKRLPLLPADHPTVLSVFASDGPNRRVVEVKVNGRDWAGVDTLFADAGPEPEGGITLLRELAVLVPLAAPPPMDRGFVQRTLEGLPRSPQLQQGLPLRWRGWQRHGGALAPALAEDELRELERVAGTLPPDYRDFLLRVGRAGAGPGYGLLEPTPAVAKRFAGSFSWKDGSSPQGAPSGVLPLAHAGCGVFWLLVLSGPERGQVWVDAHSSDEKVHREAPSFDAWYRRWIDRAVRGCAPGAIWDTRCCATVSVVSQVLTDIGKKEGPIQPGSQPLANRIAPGKLAIFGGASPYFVAGLPLDPCYPCVALATGLGMEENAFAAGASPLAPDAVTPDATPKTGGFAGWLRKLRGGAR
jgi:hypothetical protein